MKQILIFTILFLFSSVFIYAVTINVPADQPTIQAGIAAATNTDTVLVQPGTYLENINYNGKLITLASLFLTTQDTTYISSTIIDGNSMGRVVFFENSEDSTAVLCGFTITNGLSQWGGGIFCRSSSPSLENLKITGNTVSINGGGIYCKLDPSPSLQNVIITGNTAAQWGGGMFCFSSNPSLQDVTIADNNSTSAGGGIYCYDNSNPILKNTILWNDTPQEIYFHPVLNPNSITISYSDIQGGEAGIVTNGNGTVNWNDGNINSDPLFVDSVNGDYHLQASSPCIDAGDPASQHNDPDGTVSDMGAYYFPQFPPEADFTADITNGYVPLMVNFTDLSVQGTGVIDEWYWDFGDGNNSFLQNPSNEYSLPGIYTVSLTVTDVNDSTDTEIKVDYITVNPAAYNGPVWHISTTGSDITGDGSEQYPFATIQHGIDTSSDTDTVLVQPGTYVENINYNGKLITVGSLFLTTQDTTYISQTVIDANMSGRVVTFISGENSLALLCGFTITKGFTIEGAGIYCRSGSSPSLDNLMITSNYADYDGGGISCELGSSPSLDNVTISGNQALRGGGIYLSSSSSPNLQNVAITGNTASGKGGGIYCSDYSSPSLQYVTISGNSLFSADSEGGGIYCSYESNLSIENATITGNDADSGGGIYCIYATTILRNCILWNDSQPEIYIDLGGSVTATYSDIEGGTGQTWFGTGCIDSDPLFADPGNGDYHLSWANFPIPDATMSPCIDTGDPLSPSDPDGTTIEMGSYYFNQFLNAEFTADITNGEFPLMVNFTDLSTPGTMVDWYWDFGDGNNSTLQNPANEYLQPGIYTVSLTVTDVNDSTDTETKVDYITVNPAAYNGPVWHISTTGSDITGDGSELNPFATIQHGINASSNTDIILVQQGTYVENINYNEKNITVGSLFLTTQDTTYISSTIIDGNGTGIVVIFSHVETSSAVLSGFTITNGSGSSGGGISCYSSSPSLENLLVSGNSATNYGGGIYIWADSNPNLQNVTITGNSAAMAGGGISCWDSSPSLENVTISGNSAEMHGGGIHFVVSSSSLQNVTISGNSAVGGGGGICCSGSSPSLVNVNISNNSAGGGGGFGGGGIICANSSPSLENVTIIGNTSSGDGGGIHFSGSSSSLQNVTISDNSAAMYGGGIYCKSNSNPSLQNVTISGNSSAVNCGVGIYCWDSHPILINSILWNDSPQEINILSGSVTAAYSDIEGGEAGIVGNGTVNWLDGNIDTDPLFVDASNGDYSLQSTSPCIDAGDPNSPLDPDGTIADMGAYYYHQTIPPDPPQNVTVEIIGTNVHLSWDAVTGANSYKIYSSDDPYTGFVEDISGSFAGESWSAPIGEVKKFYYIKASTEIIRTKGSNSNEFINRRRK